MKTILIVGASGFVGFHLAASLAKAGHTVRCLVRTPGKGRDLSAYEVVQGDVTDAASVANAMVGIAAVYVSIHTLVRQRTTGGFMDLETQGLVNVIAACKAKGTKRLVYVTSLGVTPESPSIWVSERYKIEELVLASGLDATIIQPGQIVGRGGQGFEQVLGAARKRVAIVIGNGRNRTRPIAVEDLADTMTQVIDEPKSYGLRMEVGNDEVLTRDEMIDVASRVLGKKPPTKLHLPLPVVRALAVVLGPFAKLQQGALAGITSILDLDFIGDVSASRKVVPLVPCDYAAAIQRALAERWPHDNNRASAPSTSAP